MNISLCKQVLKNKLNLVEVESQKYADFISNEIQSFKGNDDYADMVEFCSDYLKTQRRNYFTITAKDTFSSFENADENHTFIYSPLNDHSRPLMHKGDVVFCYRQGQFENLGTALEVRGIYAVGFVLSDPQIIYPEREKHQKWGVAITIPVIIPNHLELKNIQLHPKTINLTPYNGNRNDALQYIESKVHSQALISLIIARNPSVEKKLCQLLGYTPQTEILPESMWDDNAQQVTLENDRETIKAEFKYYLENIARSARRTEEGFNLKPTAVGGFMLFLEPEKLFDYNPQKWAHIKSIFDISTSADVNRLVTDLFSDKTFIKHDQVDNQGWRSGALMHYVSFIRSLNHYSKFNFDSDDSTNAVEPLDILGLPHQQIFYGAPGTGKSYSVDDVCKKYRHFRTTFHPDSDYSTFVGCYKPMAAKKIEEFFGVQKLREMYNEFQNKYPSHTISRFVGLHYKSFMRLTNDEAYAVFKDFAADATISNILGHAIPQAEICEELTKNCSSKITYSFTPQSFTNAYIEAWRDLSKPVFLVIEEINRGNCAQIFGDLFQLLDRKGNGYSSYEIEPNTDLKNYIAEKGLQIEGVKDSDGKDISDKLMSGELMTLPPNLYIWATMNTSDQSLFPIDSAFKRRWDWKYVPINAEAKSGWKIEVNGENYSWSSFLDKINGEIEDTTSSEDKQLGFFFCKADDTDEDGNDGVISAEKFVSKVLFYLYNDVFKDYGFEREFFKDKSNNSKLITFRSFYNMDGSINEERVAMLLENLEVEVVDTISSDEGSDEGSVSANRNNKNSNFQLEVTLDGKSVEAEGDYVEVYLETLNRIGLDKVYDLNILCHGQNILSKSDYPIHTSRQINGYYAITFKLSGQIERILNEVRDQLSLDMEFDFSHL